MLMRCLLITTCLLQLGASWAQPETTAAAAPLSVWDILVEREEFLLFRQGLESANLEPLLQIHPTSSKSHNNDDIGYDESTLDYYGKQRQWTLFAPTNEAFADNLMARYFLYNLNAVHWKEHLRAMLLHQMIDLDAFTLTSLFRLQLAGGALRTTAGEIVTIDPERDMVGGQRMEAPNDLVATNGIVHAVTGFFVGATSDNSSTSTGVGRRQRDGQTSSLLDILQDGVPITDHLEKDGIESFRTLLDSLNETGLLSRPELSQDLYQENGTTFLAPRDSAFLRTPEELTTAEDCPTCYSEIVIAKQASADSAETKVDTDILLYHMLDGNMFWDDKGITSRCDQFCLVKTKHPSGAQLIVTQNEQGVLLFNNAPGIQRELGSNGILYVMNRVLEPLGMLDLFGHSILKYKDDVYPIYDKMIDDGWNSAPNNNLTSVFAAFKGWNASSPSKRFTMFMPALREENLVRLDDPEWYLHRQDLLSNLVYQGILQETELGVQATSHFTMLGGLNNTVELGQNGRMYIHGVDLFGEDNSRTIHGIDGDMILTSNRDLLPPSYKTSLETLVEYEWKSLIERYAKHWLQYTGETSYGHRPSPLLREPVTFLCPPYEDAEILLSKYYDGTSAHLLHNHFFDGILYMEQLLEMDGQVITSINGLAWIVSVLDDNVFLQPEISDEAAAGTNESFSTVMVRRGSGEHNILGSNGVVHHLESPLIDASFPTESQIQEVCGDELQSYKKCFDDCDDDVCDSGGFSTRPDIYLGFMVPGLEMSTGSIQCDALTDTLCDWRIDDYGRMGCCVNHCDDKAHNLLVCYAQKFKNTDLSKCSRKECPTASPTPSPTPRPTSSPEGGSNDDDKEAWKSFDVPQVVMFSSVVLLASVAIAVCTFECRKRAMVKELLAGENTDPSDGSEGEASVIVDFTDETKP